MIPVDAVARDRAASLLLRYLSREISNDELWASWPSSDDPALFEVGQAAWLTYDDLHEHFYEGTADELLNRAIAFLKTREPYPWRPSKRWQRVALLPLSLLTRGLVDRLFWPNPLDSNCWPFANEAAWRAATSARQS